MRYWSFVTSHQCILLTKASDAELWCFLWSALNKRLCKQSWGWWFQTPSRSLWRHRNVSTHFQSLSHSRPKRLYYYMYRMEEIYGGMLLSEISLRWRQMGAIASQITRNSTICSKVFLANNKENIKTLYFGSLLRETRRVANPSNKAPVMRKISHAIKLSWSVI